MYKKLSRGKQFLKDLCKVNFTNEHYLKYVVYLGKLLSEEMLSQEALDHPLKGEYTGFREFHVTRSKFKMIFSQNL